MEEERAIARLKQGDIAGLESLVRCHQVEAIRVAFLVTRDRSLAEDVVQTAFLRAFERIKQFEAGRPFAPWFLKIVINDAIKAAQRRERMLLLDESADPAGRWAQALARLEDPLGAAETAEVREAVWEALGHLPPAQRATIVQRYYLDMSGQEMAAAAGRPLGTIKWRLHAARRRLRRLLAPFAPPPRGAEKEREAES